jgi:hypothetical protein
LYCHPHVIALIYLLSRPTLGFPFSPRYRTNQVGTSHIVNESLLGHYS